MSDTDPLEQFHAWYDKIERLDELTRYSLAREAFFAGHAAPPWTPLLPSRDALTERQRDILRRHQPPQPNAGPPRETLDRVQKSLKFRELYGGPPADRPYPPEETMMFQKIPPETFEHTKTVWTGDPGSQMAQHLPPLPKPVDWSQHPRFEQHGTVSGSFDYTPDYGAPGPVPTPVDPEDG